PYSIPWATNVRPGPAVDFNQSLSFTLTNSDTTLFTVLPSVSVVGSPPNYPTTGSLSFTVAAFADGVDTVTLTLKDNGGTANNGQDTSAIFTFVINVRPANQPPSFANAGPVTVLEATTPSLPSIPWATNIRSGPANEPSQSVSFNLNGNSSPSLFAVAPAISPSGLLT